MRSFIQQAFPKRNLDALPAAAVGFIIILLYTRHSGIGVSPDSVVYMSAARNIHSHGTLLDFNERPLVVFPAFYPFFLSIGIFLTGLDPMTYAPALNALLFAMVILISGRIMEGFLIRSTWQKQAVLSCMALSPCLLEVYSMLWSETLFILLLLAFFITVRSYLQSGTLKSLLACTGITALACITRYAGVTLLATGGLLILLQGTLPFTKKFQHALLYGFGGSLLLSLNLIRNHTIEGTLTGMREKSLTSLHDNLYYYGNTLSYWLPLPKDHPVFGFWAGVVILLILAILWFRGLFRWPLASFELMAVFFTLFYSLFIIISATFSRYELINSRLLSPVFIPFIWTISTELTAFTRVLRRKAGWMGPAMALCLWLTWQANQYFINKENYDGIRDAGIPGYTEDPWRQDSEFVNFLRSHKGIFRKGYNIYSNADDALYFFTGIRCDMIPHKVFPQEINDFYQEPNCYLVWFDDNENSELITREDILKHKKMIQLYKLSNGTIYVSEENPVKDYRK